MESCIYRGRVSHRRFGAAGNRFRYSVFMLYLDLAELDQVFRPYWLWSTARPAPAWFRRADHYGDPGLPLDQCIRDLVERDTGRRPDGAIRLLTNLRYFGYVFNPLSAYYCFDRDGNLQSVVLEVSNLPWREMHCYVLSDGRPLANGALDYQWGKSFHVSPFLPMDMSYRCRLDAPGEQLHLALENRRNGAKTFDAHLNLERVPIGHGSLARMLALDPLITLRVTALIHWQAARLWLKRAPVYDHPRRT